MDTKIVGIVGSLRKFSYNRGLMNAFAEAIPNGVKLEIAEIASLPLFNADLEADLPAVVRDIKIVAGSADAIIISTPEYNRSVPGVLKNAVDWLSRPHAENSFKGKPVLVVGASPGATGTSMAQYHLKQSLLHLDAQVLGQPEFFVGGAMNKFDESGKLTDEKTKQYIDAALKKLIDMAKK